MNKAKTDTKVIIKIRPEIKAQEKTQKIRVREPLLLVKAFKGLLISL